MAEPQPDAAYAHPVAALFTIAFKVGTSGAGKRCADLGRLGADLHALRAGSSTHDVHPLRHHRTGLHWHLCACRGLAHARFLDGATPSPFAPPTSSHQHVQFRSYS